MTTGQDDTGDTGGGATGNVVREFALTPWAQEALVELVTITGFAEVDLVNRALQLYARIEGRRASGDALYLLDPENLMFRVRLDGW